MKLIYDVNDKPTFGKIIVFAFQQMIAIMAATLLVPIIISSQGLTMDPAAALFGAGIGTLVYIFCTKRRSPVFLGSSFTFLGAMGAAAAQNYGYWGLIIGVAFAGGVYLIISLVICFVGTNWLNKLLPAVIIGPIVAIIGLSLSGTATQWLMSNTMQHVEEFKDIYNNTYYLMVDDYNLLSIFCGLVSFFVIVLTSVKGSKTLKLIPFIIGIGAGYALALIFTLIGKATNVEYLQLLDFTPFKNAFGKITFESFFALPDFTFLMGIQHGGEYEPINGVAIGNLALLFAPIGIVELAQHIADHKNLGTIIERDLIKDPGLSRTLLGDGLGSIVGAFFGGCANTTYGESVGCVAITKNASIITIICAAIGCMILSFFTPFVAVIESIPKCVMGGACVALYGFIAVSGLQMLKEVDLGDNRNLFVVSAILVCGIGGLALNFGTNKTTGEALLSITSIATALIVGILTNLLVNIGRNDGNENEKDGLSANISTIDENTTSFSENEPENSDSAE